MAGLIWTEAAIADLDEIAEYIALDNVEAAKRVVARIYHHIGRLVRHPMSGPVPPELTDHRYRQIAEPPCRVIYRYDGEDVYIAYVMRSERVLRRSILDERNVGEAD